MSLSLSAIIVFLIWVSMAFSSAQQFFLSSTNSTPCFGDTVDLICYYPDVMKMVNGQPRYIVTIPSWRMNGKRLFPDEDILDVVIVNETASRLRVRFDPANFTGDPVSFTCFLPLTGGGEDSASRVVDPQETAKQPVFQSRPLFGENGSSATVTWDHTDQGPCFTNLTFSYNITWYPVVGGVVQWGERQSAVTGPGATEYTITNLMNGTDYQVKLFGFTSSDPVVYSEVATVNITDEPFEENPPKNEVPSRGSVLDPVAIAVAIPIGIIACFVVSIAILVTVFSCTKQRGSYPVTEHSGTTVPAASASIGNVEKQRHRRKKTAGASVLDNTGDDVSVTLSSDELADTVTSDDMDAYESSTEHQSDQFQSHYAELDRKWLSEKRYNHPEQEMFNVPYAVVDRAATASGAPPLVKETPVPSEVTRMGQCNSDFDDPPIPGVLISAITQATQIKCWGLEESELVVGTAKISQPSVGLPLLSCGLVAEETSADSAGGLSIINYKVNAYFKPKKSSQKDDTITQEAYTTPDDGQAAPNARKAAPDEVVTTTQEIKASGQPEDASPLEEAAALQDVEPFISDHEPGQDHLKAWGWFCRLLLFCVQGEHVEADTRMITYKSFLDYAHKESSIPAVKTEAQANVRDYQNLEDSECVQAVSTFEMSQQSGTPALSYGTEKTDADSMGGLVISNYDKAGELLLTLSQTPHQWRKTLQQMKNAPCHKRKMLYSMKWHHSYVGPFKSTVITTSTTGGIKGFPKSNGAAQRVFLSGSSTNPTPCFGDTVDLICYYPDVMERVNGQLRYSATTASYRMNGELVFPDDDVFDQSIINQMASRLRVSIDPATFTGDPVSFTCFLSLTGGGDRGQHQRYHRPTRYTATFRL